MYKISKTVGLYSDILNSILKNRFNIRQLPSFCTFFATWRCNLKCRMCEIWKKKNFRKEMSIDEIKKAFRNLGKLHAIRITGGEPFVRDDTLELVNAIQSISQPAVIHITTNGYFTEKILDFAKRINNPGRLHIKVSLLGSKEIHDEITQIPEAFKQAVETIRRLSEVKKKFRFYFGVGYTVSTESALHDYSKIKNLCKEFNIDLLPVVAYGKTALYSSEENLNLLPEDSLELNIIDTLPKSCHEALVDILLKDSCNISSFIEKAIRKYYTLGFSNRLIKHIPYPKPPNCAELINHIRILPNGNIPVCLYCSEVVGNILVNDLRDLWFSEKIEPYRNKVKTCPICWAGCEVTPNAIYSGGIIKYIL